MNLKTYYFILFVIIANSIFGQEPKLIKAETEIYREDEDFWRGSTLKFYEYSVDLLTKYTRQAWFSMPEKYINKEIIEYQYNEDNQLKLRLRYLLTSENAIVENFYWDEYFYNEKGCLIALKDSVSSIHGVYDQHYIEYEVDENCNAIGELKTSLALSGNISFRKTSSVYNESNVLIKDTLYRFKNEHWKVERINDYSYDPKGRLIKHHLTVFLNFSLLKETEDWTFDEHDQLVYNVRWRDSSYSPNQLVKKDSIVIEYDEQNRVSKKQVHRTNFTTIEPIDYYTYDYYCQDILKQSSKGDYPGTYRTFYEYAPGFDDECAEEVEDISITIYPNPNNGEMTIKSDLLGAENAMVRVYDVTGKELFVQDYTILKNIHPLNLTFLIPGIYFISIQTDAIVVTEKVMIL